MKIRIIAVLCLSFLLSLTAAACDYDGYIFKTAEPVVLLLSDDAAIAPAEFADNLYTADTLEEIYAAVDPSYIEYVEPNYIVELYDVPDDTYYPAQWYAKTIGIEKVWEKYDALSPVTVAVIDSGLMYNHEDFDYADRIIDGYNVLTKTNNTSDTHGHGTLVSGIIAATRGNGKGVAGLADNAKIVPIKAFSGKTSSLDAVVDAIYCAVDEYDADVINMSFGFTTDPQSLKTAVEYAYSKGVIMCAAVGNDGKTNIEYPAGYDCVIGVGATDREDGVCTFSQRNASVFVTAPGLEICSTYNSTNPDGTYYMYGSGTSFSAPVVAALAAVAKGINPALSPDDFMKLLSVTSVDLGDVGRDDCYGYGLVDAAALTDRLTNPVVTFPENVTVSTPVKTLKSGDSVPVGTKLTINCALPAQFEPEIYVGNTRVAPSGELTAGYGDIEITVKHKGLSCKLDADGNATVGGYALVGESSTVVAVVARYTSDGRMSAFTAATLTADSDGRVDVPSVSVPKGESCKVFVFFDFKTLTLVSLTEFE